MIVGVSFVSGTKHIAEFTQRVCAEGIFSPVSLGPVTLGARLDEAGPLRLDHIGIAVRGIASSRVLYEALGLTVGIVEMVEHEQVKTAMIEMGRSRIELLEATRDESTIGRFIAKHGEGVHHIAVHADDIDARFETLKARGVRLVSDAIRLGAGGHRYFFVHPASTGGVLIEIVGDGSPPEERKPA